MDIKDWLTWDAVATFATTVMLVRYWVEYTKSGLDNIVVHVGSWFKREWHSPTFAYAIVSAFALILAFGHARMTPLNFDQTMLDFINAFAVAIVAGFMQRPQAGDVIQVDPNDIADIVNGANAQTTKGEDKGDDSTVVKGFAG